MVALGVSALAVFLFAARLADAIMWSCDIGGGALVDYAIGLIGIVILVWMGIASVADFGRDSGDVAKPADEKVEN